MGAAGPVPGLHVDPSDLCLHWVGGGLGWHDGQETEWRQDWRVAPMDPVGGRGGLPAGGPCRGGRDACGPDVALGALAVMGSGHGDGRDVALDHHSRVQGRTEPSSGGPLSLRVGRPRPQVVADLGGGRKGRRSMDDDVCGKPSRGLSHDVLGEPQRSDRGGAGALVVLVDGARRAVLRISGAWGDAVASRMEGDDASKNPACARPCIPGGIQPLARVGVTRNRRKPCRLHPKRQQHWMGAHMLPRGNETGRV